MIVFHARLMEVNRFSLLFFLTDSLCSFHVSFIHIILVRTWIIYFLRIQNEMRQPLARTVVYIKMLAPKTHQCANIRDKKKTKINNKHTVSFDEKEIENPESTINTNILGEWWIWSVITLKFVLVTLEKSKLMHKHDSI